MDTHESLGADTAFGAKDLGLEALAKLVEASLDGITLADQEGLFVYANPAACKILGYSLQELIGQSMFFPSAERDRQAMADLFTERWSGTGSSVVVRPDGEERQIEFSAAWIDADGRTYTAGIFQDVTDARRAEREGAALMEIASQVAFGDSLESTLNVLCERVVGATGAEAAAVALRDPASGQVSMVGAHGLSYGYVEGANKILASGTPLILQEAYRGGKPMFMTNMRSLLLASKESAPIHQFVQDVAWDTIVAVPMVYKDSSVGLLLSYHLPTRSIGEAELSFHRAIADQAAVAVENARLLALTHDKAALEERQKLARELHDSVSQAIFSISLQARTAQTLLRADPAKAQEPLSHIASLSQAAMAEMRALIFELRPESLQNEGLVAAIEKQASALRARHNIRVRTELCEEPALTLEQKQVVYRITQEALHNTVKHARATQVTIKMECNEQWLTLEVKDNGVGFDPAGTFPGHLGLQSMRERAAKLGATLQIESAPGSGTYSRLRLPVG